jgi:hypothetical protein
MLRKNSPMPKSSPLALLAARLSQSTEPSGAAM